MKSTAHVAMTSWGGVLSLLLSMGCGGAAAREPRLGDCWVLLTRVPTPSGMREERTECVLADTVSGQGRFESRRDGGRVLSKWRALRGEAPSRERDGEPGASLERLRVPAGAFSCRRTTTTFTERNGRVMRVDEWWAQGVPVPVQRYVRWQGLADARLHAPPGRPADLILGSELSVLERAPER